MGLTIQDPIVQREKMKVVYPNILKTILKMFVVLGIVYILFSNGNQYFYVYFTQITLEERERRKEGTKETYTPYKGTSEPWNKMKTRRETTGL